jgi:hypothetical protein
MKLPLRNNSTCGNVPIESAQQLFADALDALALGATTMHLT